MKELLAEKTSERVWTFSIREIYPALNGIWTPDRSLRSVVAIRLRYSSSTKPTRLNNMQQLQWQLSTYSGTRITQNYTGWLQVEGNGGSWWGGGGCQCWWGLGFPLRHRITATGPASEPTKLPARKTTGLYPSGQNGRYAKLITQRHPAPS
jgi:hypothetical protein